MRRISALVVIILSIVLVLASCGGQNSTPASTESPAESATASSTQAAVNPGPDSPSNAKAVRIFYTNDGLGEIDPCG